ncbi:hypothetical protein [Planococcus halocryophilus]|uniref:hypothetical protein n=1 Tax=Planococcus halocryophilus TaxID=1215089 RepID=UPI001F0F503F|nr:hypothetical protein [Planococcus halocryophilus]MCH4826643.1 hypothetical protein [Planococcus halocryophilus]
MSQNIIEHLRQEAIQEIFKMKTFETAWAVWQKGIQGQISPLNANNVLNLGDNLGDIFRSTGVAGRRQEDVSTGGNVWEALICWYLNLCLVGSRTVVFKQKKALLPTPVREALTVSYGTFPSNTESDLIAITFPEKSDYTSIDKHSISIRNDVGNLIPTLSGKKYNFLEISNALLSRDFNDLEIGVIQCKTNWNDNAQVPMLWDMIYSSSGFSRHSIVVGTSLYSIRDLKKFSYSFVTVPTVKMSKINHTSTCVRRVQNLSGGNYWGYPSRASVANSIKDIFGRNFSSASTTSLAARLRVELPNLRTTYSYFNI